MATQPINGNNVVSLSSKWTEAKSQLDLLRLAGQGDKDALKAVEEQGLTFDIVKSQADITLRRLMAAKVEQAIEGELQRIKLTALHLLEAKAPAITADDYTLKDEGSYRTQDEENLLRESEEVDRILGDASMGLLMASAGVTPLDLFSDATKAKNTVLAKKAELETWQIANANALDIARAKPVRSDNLTDSEISIIQQGHFRLPALLAQYLVSKVLTPNSPQAAERLAIGRKTIGGKASAKLRSAYYRAVSSEDGKRIVNADSFVEANKESK